MSCTTFHQGTVHGSLTDWIDPSGSTLLDYLLCLSPMYPAERWYNYYIYIRMYTCVPIYVYRTRYPFSLVNRDLTYLRTHTYVHICIHNMYVHMRRYPYYLHSYLCTYMWIGSMEFSSHRDFISSNVSTADCYLHQWYDYKECVRC